MKPTLLALAAALALAGCTTAQVQTASTSVISTAQADVTKALGFYQTAKGIALVAEIAQPSLKSYVDGTIARLDPIAAGIQLAAPGAAGIATQAASLVDEAVALESATAVAIKAVPAKV